MYVTSLKGKTRARNLLEKAWMRALLKSNIGITKLKLFDTRKSVTFDDTSTLVHQILNDFVPNFTILGDRSGPAFQVSADLWQ